MQGLAFSNIYISSDNKIRNAVMTFSMLPLVMGEMKIFKSLFPDENLTIPAILFMSFIMISAIIFLAYIFKDYNKKSSSTLTIGRFMSDPSILKIDHIKHSTEEELVKLVQTKKEISTLLENSQISSFSIPKDYNVVLTNITINRFKQNISSVSDFLCKLNTQTDQFIEEYTLTSSTKDSEFQFKAYLYGLARTIESTLFSSNTCRSRVHFRLLNKETNEYNKYLICEDGKKVDNYLTPMKANSGIIQAAIEERVSFVKSANISLHQKAQNDAIWKDYITMVFFGKIIQEDSREPFLSMTVSIDSPEEYQQLLYFLSFINIERYIQLNIERIYELCPIKPK